MHQNLRARRKPKRKWCDALQIAFAACTCLRSKVSTFEQDDVFAEMESMFSEPTLGASDNGDRSTAKLNALSA